MIRTNEDHTSMPCVQFMIVTLQFKKKQRLLVNSYMVYHKIVTFHGNNETEIIKEYV